MERHQLPPALRRQEAAANARVIVLLEVSVGMFGVPAGTSVLSPARRVRHVSLRLGLLVSITAFIFVGGDVFLEQWIEGRASTLFIFGTACLIAAASILLFVFITSIGLVVSHVLSDDPPPRNQARAEIAVGGSQRG